MTLPVAEPGFYADLSGLAALRRGARADDPAALREAARQFESLFAKMLLSSMRAASFGDSLLGSDQQDFYQGMFDDQLAVELTRGRGLGLAELLVEQLTRAGLVAEPGAESSAARAPGPTSAGIAQSPDEFVRKLWPSAVEAGRELGVDPRNLLAHAALETGWGRALPCGESGRSSFNLFGMKADAGWNGPSVTSRTLEFESGIPVEKRERFRAYEAPEDSFRDYVALLRGNPRYAAALNTGSDTWAFARALESGGYATDPDYAGKLAAIAQNLSPPPDLKSVPGAP